MAGNTSLKPVEGPTGSSSATTGLARPPPKTPPVVFAGGLWKPDEKKAGGGNASKGEAPEDQFPQSTDIPTRSSSTITDGPDVCPPDMQGRLEKLLLDDSIRPL
jgi:hypothetical protein